MKPILLFYNLHGDKRTQLGLLCQELGIEVREVAPEQYAQPIGVLLDMMPPIAAPMGRVEDEMLVMAYFDQALLTAFLAQMRQRQIPPVALKATLTLNNMTWSSETLCRELRREHEAMLRKYGK